jgi:hypothetical protein
MRQRSSAQFTIVPKRQLLVLHRPRPVAWPLWPLTGAGPTSSSSNYAAIIFQLRCIPQPTDGSTSSVKTTQAMRRCSKPGCDSCRRAWPRLGQAAGTGARRTSKVFVVRRRIHAQSGSRPLTSRDRRAAIPRISRFDPPSMGWQPTLLPSLPRHLRGGCGSRFRCSQSRAAQSMCAPPRVASEGRLNCACR